MPKRDWHHQSYGAKRKLQGTRHYFRRRWVQPSARFQSTSRRTHRLGSTSPAQDLRNQGVGALYVRRRNMRVQLSARIDARPRRGMRSARECNRHHRPRQGLRISPKEMPEEFQEDARVAATGCAAGLEASSTRFLFNGLHGASLPKHISI